MKRFDKRCIYTNLLSDLVRSALVLFLFFQNLIVDENGEFRHLPTAIPLLCVAFGVIYACFILYRVMFYKTSGYELTETEIVCKSGVFFRKRSILEYKKVHAINKKQTLIHRIFGIAVLTVDSGSANTAHQAEITIIERSKTVDELLHRLNALKEGTAPASEEVAPQEEVLLSDEDSLYRFTSKKKMLYTLINIATGVFYVAFFGILSIAVLGICKWVLELEELGTWGQYFFGSILLMLGAMLICSVFSFIGCMINSFVKYHNFTVKKQDNNIQISYGLLEKQTNTFSYDRIKAVKISQGLVQRMLGFASIRLEVIGYLSQDENNNSTELGVLVPFCKYDEVGEILGKVLPAFVPDKKQTKAVAYFPFVSWFFLIFGVVAGVALLQAVASMRILNVPASIVNIVVLATVGATAVVWAFKALHAALSYQNNGIALSSGKITVYSGGFFKTVTVFMAKNLVAAETVTTPLRQRHGITSLVMHLKTNAMSNEIKVHIQSADLSAEMERQLTL